jgi:hypothetical protein
MFQQGYFDDYKYVVHTDLRDSRAFHWPQWGNHSQLWLQSIHRTKSLTCGGFQSGERLAMAGLMKALAGAIRHQACSASPVNDQHLLITLFLSGRLGVPRSKVALDESIINSQQTRVFDGQTAFVHGDWWMSKNLINDPYANWAYPHGVPYGAIDTASQ